MTEFRKIWLNFLKKNGGVYMVVRHGGTSVNPVDLTTYRYLLTAITTRATSSFTASKFVVHKAVSTFIIQYVEQSTIGTNENVTHRLANITKGTSVDFASIPVSASLTAYYSASLSCDAGDEIEYQQITPAWVANPTAWLPVANIMY